ncbi:MAG: alpha/beta hydrolase [Cyanothece sp. SIO1E1]|nr:alpha/beta hydrolase [Cyanothece sp. SIO1E1]
MINTISVIIWFIGLLLPGNIAKSDDGEYMTFQGEVALNGDVRNLLLEIDQDDLTKIRWSIDKAGRHRLPLINTTYSPVTKSFKGELSFIGLDREGSIEGQLTNSGIEGILSWHGKKVSFSLRKVKVSFDYSEEGIEVRNGEVTIRGTLVLPRGKQKAPLVAFAHGSGPASRWWGMYWAHEFAKMGIASFLHDKRGCGESSGNWMKSSLDDLASDIESSLSLLKDHPRIDSTKMGIYGVSQGAWVATKIGARNPELSFLIGNSGGGISPYEKEMLSYENNMRHAGIEERGIQEGLALVEEYMTYLRTANHRQQLKAKLEAAADQAWYPILGLQHILVSEDNVPNWQWVATYRTEKDIEQLDMPILLLFGDHDHIIPVERSMSSWQEWLSKGGNQQVEFKVFPGAGHGLRLGGHHASGFPKYPQDHIEIISAWFRKSGIIPSD